MGGSHPGDSGVTLGVGPGGLLRLAHDRGRERRLGAAAALLGRAHGQHRVPAGARIAGQDANLASTLCPTVSES